jgi:hypothetical protein
MLVVVVVMPGTIAVGFGKRGPVCVGWGGVGWGGVGWGGVGCVCFFFFWGGGHSAREGWPCRSCTGCTPTHTCATRCCLQVGATRLSDTIQQLQRAREELGERSASLAASQVQVEALSTALRLAEQRCTALAAERSALSEAAQVGAGLRLRVAPQRCDLPSPTS